MRIFFSLLFFVFNFHGIQTAGAQSNVEYFFRNTTAYKDVVVARVIKTDLIELESGEKIRLIGLNCPKVPRKREMIDRDQHGFVINEKSSPETSIEETVFDSVKELLEGKHVRLEFDVERKDEDHYSFAYVFLLKDNLFMNVEILRQGYANLQIQPPNLKYADQLRKAYQEAYRESRGLQNK